MQPQPPPNALQAAQQSQPPKAPQMGPPQPQQGGESPQAFLMTLQQLVQLPHPVGDAAKVLLNALRAHSSGSMGSQGGVPTMSNGMSAMSPQPGVPQ